jgi:hypothetical protein
MFTVEDIGNEEFALQKRMPKDGYIEYRDKYLTENGLYDEWREIYKRYVFLAQNGDVEALKRALFYAWYQLSEPNWLSGIGSLPDDETRILVDLLEKRLSNKVYDKELEQMLRYYMAVCEYYLERFYPLPFIQKTSASTEDRGRPKLESGKWSYRGKMGEYWSEE